MRDPRSRLVLAAMAGLLPGVLVGFVLTPSGPGFEAQGRIERTGSGTVGATGPRAEGTDAPDAHVGRGHGDGARLGSAPVARPSNGAGADQPTGRPTGPGAASGAETSVRAELLALLASGRIEERLASDPDALLHLLVRLNVELGDPAAALALLERQADVDAGRWEALFHLCSSSAPDVATQAMRRAFECHLAAIDAGQATASFDWPAAGYLQNLANVDPTAALELLQQLRARGLVDNPDVTYFEAGALAQAGMVDRARDILEALVADPEQFASALSHLATVDPRAAEVHLREALSGEWSGWARGQLLALLVGQGRTLESIEIFEQSLAAGLADGSTWWQMLSSVPRATIDAELERWLALGPQNVDALSSIANYFAGQGDTQRAFDMFEQMWSTALDQGAYLPQLPYDLIKAQPGAALALLDQAQGSLPENDEMWGDLADAYWQAGEQDLAVAAWQHAQELDPDDGEWTGKLATAANGGVPVWMGEQTGPLGDTSDLWGQPPPLDLFDGYAPVGLGYWEGDIEVEYGGIPLLGGTSDVAGNLVQVGYVGADW